MSTDEKKYYRSFTRCITTSRVTSKNPSCENFCVFLGKLCDVAKDETKSFRDCLRQSVVGCLHDWISLFQTADEWSQEAELKVTYLCNLLELTKSVLTTEKQSWIKSCYGKIKNCILCEKVARSLRENLLDHVIKCSLQTTKTTAESLPSTKTVSDSHLSDDSDAYKNVKKMLSDLELTHLLEKFQDNLIRDTLLCAEKNELKSTLQEASFAPGAILEIQLYLEKNGVNFNDDVPEKTTDTKASRDVDPQRQVKDFENSLKQILSEIAFENQKQAEKQNEAEQTIQNENQNESNSEFENVKPLDIIKELQNRTPVPTFTSVCRPPPGFSYPGNENRSTASPIHVEEIEANSNESSLGNDFPELISKREVSLGEKKDNIMEFKDENTQAGNPVVNWTQNGGSFQPNERPLPKYKGRGRGRRDVSGTLEDSKNDNSESQGFSEDTRGPRWNSKDVRGFNYGFVRDKNGYGESLQSNNSHSPETSRKDNNRPLSSRRDIKGFSWNDDRPLGNSNAMNESTSKYYFGTDTTENTYGQEARVESGSYTSAGAGFGTSRVPFGSSAPVGCFICGAKDHRSAYCKNNAAMFD